MWTWNPMSALRTLARRACSPGVAWWWFCRAGQRARWEAFCARSPAETPCSHPSHPIPVRALCQSPIYQVSPKHTLYCPVLWRQTWFLRARCCHAGLCPHRVLSDPGSNVSTPSSSGAGVALREVLCAAVASCALAQGAAATPAGSAGSESQRGWAFLSSSQRPIPSQSLLWLSHEKPSKDANSPAWTPLTGRLELSRQRPQWVLVSRECSGHLGGSAAPTVLVLPLLHCHRVRQHLGP